MIMKFQLGQVVATPGVVESIPSEEMTKALARHVSGDGGDLCAEDAAMNAQAIKTGEDRIFSMYHSKAGVKFYIITEWDRSVTTFLLPSEY